MSWSGALYSATLIMTLCMMGCTGKLSETAPMPPGTPGMPSTPGKPGVPGEPPPAARGESFQCDPDATPPELPLRRLSQAQYAQTLRDLIEALAPERAQPIWQEAVAPQLELLPTDQRQGLPDHTHGGFRRLDQVVQQAHVDVTLTLAEALASALVAPSDWAELLLGECVEADDSAACVASFIREIGALTHRRPLSDAEVAFYERVYDAQGIDRDGVRDVLTVMLTAPELLYHVEHGAPDGADAQVHPLSAWELANRLSYHFWQTMPDAALREAAASGALLTPEGYEAQVERLVADPRAQRAIGAFFKEWLWLDDLPELSARVGSPQYDAFVGDRPAPSPALRDAMIDEILAMARYYTLDAPDSFAAMMRSPHSFAKSPELAALYEVAPWDGQGAPPELPAEHKRAGMLTRAALLSTGTINTRPIMKGYMVRQAMLCVKPPPPPDNAVAMTSLELTDSSSTRQVVEAITEQPGSTCAGCHLLFLNPLGFATEGFDALGRARAEQPIFDEQGQLLGVADVRTDGVPRVNPWDEREVADAIELTDMMLESGEPQACFARHYARFTFGRAEDLTRDGCTLRALHQQVLRADSLQDVMRAVALRPEFQRRDFR